MHVLEKSRKKKEVEGRVGAVGSSLCLPGKNPFGNEMNEEILNDED